MLYGIFVFFMSWLFSIVIKEVKGLDNIPKNGCIVASNHTSYLDPPLLGSYIATKLRIKVHYLGKEELFKSFIGKILHKSVETIPIDTTGKHKSWLSGASKYIKKKEIIGIFPEGGRSRDGKLQRGKTGVVRLALTTKSPVVPMGIKGTYELWPVHKKLFKIKKIVKVNIGKPIYFDRHYKRKITKKLLRKLTKKLMMEIARLSGQGCNP
ncbi:MAG: lysophospholipid acyltransferase family protein [Candidatus Woesearchaeota archaeon]|jgi:1-acyl-sn-glycerol-3-phosphate acyltransferase|nr:lysophospholipid acyltransferase family protein [Candidatus Woesearchaeota archaeon]|tara:strand:+ start:3584 stop:4213 length:630 start_codon:yes stop_codon:yes gene_type:complete